MPEIGAELYLLDPSESPGGSVPEEMLQVKGALPPLTLTVAELGVPATHIGCCVGGMAGNGLTVIRTEADFVESLIEVAVTATGNELVTETGAV